MPQLAEEKPSCIFAGLGDVLPPLYMCLSVDSRHMNVAAKKNVVLGVKTGMARTYKDNLQESLTHSLCQR